MQSDRFDIETPVLIVGGGPVGMTLALELNLHGVAAILCERNPETTKHPKMDITNGRSMELFRRLGVAKELRSKAIPAENPFNVIWATKLNGWELARFEYPTVAEMWTTIKQNKTGALPIEPNMRVSQVIVEPTLKGILERDAPNINMMFGWKFESYEQDPKGVTSHISHFETGERRRVRSEYLVGCDGAGSRVRRQLGIELDTVSIKELLVEAGGLWSNLWQLAKTYARGDQPNSGELYIIHFKSKDKETLDRFGVAWHLQNPDGAILIGQNDVDTWTLHTPLKSNENANKLDPKQRLREVLGEGIDAEILVANSWTPSLGLAQSYGSGRVWLAGDSAHQVIPTGGYGMNTGVGDAVDLGWKLGAYINGWGGDGLLSSYELERRPIGERNKRASMRHTGVRIKVANAASPSIHKPTRRGDRARRHLGERISELGNLENEALGIEMGYRYYPSPITIDEASEPPRDSLDTYTPSTWPGARPPGFWIDEEVALFDQFDPRGFTLINFARIDVTVFEESSKELGVPLKILPIENDQLRFLYERDLVLIRPDQHVAWRGNDVPENPYGILEKVSGRA